MVAADHRCPPIVSIVHPGMFHPIPFDVLERISFGSPFVDRVAELFAPPCCTRIVLGSADRVPPGLGNWWGS